jgi:pSer/pThr/pTyr-binding forkhead associated (FHA) protein
MMSQRPTMSTRARPWLLSRSGALAGTRFPVAGGLTRIGRAPDNDVVVAGSDSATVSLYHAEIDRNGESCRIRDLQSTNGTWLDGERITEAEVTPGTVIQLGTQGPEFVLLWEESAPSELDRTVEVPLPPITDQPRAPVKFPGAAHEDLLSYAVACARRMRAHGVGGQTMNIMRDVIDQALRQTHRRFRVIGYSLLAALVIVSSAAFWKITALKKEKRGIDSHIQQLEAQLLKSTDSASIDNLLAQLSDYQSEAESLQRTLLYRVSALREGDFVTTELHSVMAEFGAEVYSIPPDFVERVNHYIELDQGPDHPLIAHALNEASGQLQLIRKMLQEEQLPPDLAYLPLVESALRSGQESAAGAVGPWQFAQVTARAYGLRVDEQVDERKDLVKSTRASCKYLRDLILDFGAGSSVMLALAAYDSGAAKVKQAVTHTVRDPIKQRNFWYLYRTRALPLETREYVPKVFAAILIGRNPHHFGF